MNKAEKFWDKRAKSFDNRDNPMKPERKEKYKKVSKYLHSSDRMLDFGCATGSLSIQFAEDVLEIHGIDISQNMLDQASNKIEKLGISNVSFSKSELSSLDKESFDKILAFYVLHLVPEVSTTIQELKAVLKPGGLLIAEVPCLGEARGLKKWIMSLFTKLIGLPHLKKFKGIDLQNKLENAGFEIVHSDVFKESIPRNYIVAKKIS